MKHLQLTRIAQELGYASITNEGLCKGFSAMLIQAACCGQIERFYKRLEILEQYKDKPEKLKSDIAVLQKLSKTEQEIPDNHQILEIPAFFEGIALYLNPEIGAEMFGGRSYFQDHEIEISAYIQSKELENLGGLHCALRTNDQYNQKELAEFLKGIGQELKDYPDSAINLSCNNHSVAIRVLGKDQFQLIETDSLDELNTHYNSQQLAKKLNKTFNKSWRNWIGERPLVMSVSVFTSKANPLNLNHLKATHPLIPSQDSIGFTVLECAAENNDVDTLRRIDFTKIYAPKISRALEIACFRCSNDVADFLLKLPSIDLSKSNAIFAALKSKNYSLVEKIRKHPTFNLHATYRKGNVLHAVAAAKHAGAEAVDLAKQFIDSGVDINAKDIKGYTPLRTACHYGNLELAKLLLKHGADPKEKNIDNITVLHVAVKSGHLELVQELLDRYEEGDKNCNAKTLQGNTPFHFACATGNKAMVEKLLSYADCDIRTKENLTPLGVACKNNHLQLIPILLEKTTLSINDIKPDSALLQKIAQCDIETQNNFLKKALECYIAHRNTEPEYKDLLHTGFSKTEKISAAQALLNKLKGDPINLKSHLAALNDKRLSSLYGMYNRLHPVVAFKSDENGISPSYSTMIKVMPKAVHSSPRPDAVPLKERQIMEESSDKKQEQVESSIKSPTPFKTSPL